jgi:hypothetical protein
MWPSTSPSGTVDIYPPTAVRVRRDELSRAFTKPR